MKAYGAAAAAAALSAARELRGGTICSSTTCRSQCKCRSSVSRERDIGPMQFNAIGAIAAECVRAHVLTSSASRLCERACMHIRADAARDGVGGGRGGGGGGGIEPGSESKRGAERLGFR